MTSTLSPYSSFQECRHVFVYGTLKRGHGNHKLLRAATFMGTTRTKGRYALGDIGFPYAFPETVIPSHLHSRLCHPVVGECYMLHSPSTLETLDHLEGYPTHYDRTVVELLNLQQAWMYVMPDWHTAVYCDACEFKNGGWSWPPD